MTELLEGRISALAALRAGRRTIVELLVRQGIKDDSIRDLLDAAAERGVPLCLLDVVSDEAATARERYGLDA